jgi:hypothetical protein
MMTSYCSRPSLHRFLSQSLIVGTLSAIGLLSGFTPGISKDFHSLEISSIVYAQRASLSTEDIKSYAKAVWAIEQLRLSAYNEIKKIIGSSDIPEIVCNRPASINALPEAAQGVAQNYCNQSAAIVANYFPRGRNSRFNQITNLMQTNGDVRSQIQQELLNLQQ